MKIGPAGERVESRARPIWIFGGPIQILGSKKPDIDCGGQDDAKGHERMSQGQWRD